MDVKSTFLNGELQEEIYIEQPKCFHLKQKPNYVFRLKKEFYGLKQVLRAWYSNIYSYLLKYGFKIGATEKNLYVKENDDKIIVVVVYVYDIIFASNSDLLKNGFLGDMKAQFEMYMLGEISYFLGLKITQTHNGIFISQGKYLKEMLNKFGIEECSLVSTPMVIGCKVSKLDEYPTMEHTLYRSIIGNLLY